MLKLKTILDMFTLYKGYPALQYLCRPSTTVHILVVKILLLLAIGVEWEPMNSTRPNTYLKKIHKIQYIVLCRFSMKLPLRGSRRFIGI